MKVQFRVTKKDIENGRKKSCLKCPVALSMARRGFDCSVGVMDMYIHTPKTSECFELPCDVQNFIFDFDYGVTVYPFKFTLDIPKKMLPSKLKKRK